ncbi:MAG: flippase [Candidatus Stahlbacteria bacterium]|nr:flippase [Candidatus Stahlbacteria bacterium]
MSRFTKDTFITFVAKIVQLIIGIGISVIIARSLGPEGKGIYSLAILMPTLLILFTQLGIGPASVFYIGRKEYPIKEIFGANIIFSIIISIIATGIGLIISLFFAEKLFPGVNREYLVFALLLIPLQLFFTFVINILLGLQEIKKYNLIHIIRSTIYLLLIAIFLLWLKSGIKAAIIAGLLSFFFGCIILFICTKKKTDGLSFSIKRNLSKNFIAYGSKSYFGNIATFLHLRIDIWMVNIFLNPTAVGFYSVAVGLAEEIWLVSQSASIVLFPKVSSEDNAKRLKEFTPLVCRNILFITFLGALVLFLLGHWLILLFYSKNFLNAVIPFQILLIGTVAISGSRILMSDFAGRGKPIINTYIGIISLVLNVILNIFLIPALDISGASLASAISYFFLFILSTIIYSRISGNKIKDIIFIKKSDFRYYKNLIFLNKNKYFNFSK